MSLIVKIMSGEDMPDDDARKTHRLFADVKRVHFERAVTGGAQITLGYSLDHDDADSFRIEGNVYVMNEAGRTIDQFGVAEYQRFVAATPSVG